MSKVRVLGMMSGTSMDGVDAAVIETDGEDRIEFGPAASFPYPSDVQEALLGARGWDVSPEIHQLVEVLHSPNFVTLKTGPLDLIGFHGQTLAHEPKKRRTLQAGNGAQLAAKWGKPVVWDFRSADVASGGQGAPLAPLFHFHALRAMGLSGKQAVLNLGGVGNVTWMDLDKPSPAYSGAILAFDTGPGNAVMDDVLRVRSGQAYDAAGALAAQGRADPAIIETALRDPYFAQEPPKSLDRDYFSQLDALVKGLPLVDAMATLNAVTCATVVRAADVFPAPVEGWYITGGGRLNTTMMDILDALIEVPVAPVEAIGLDGDMLEAQAFAWLAVRSLHRLPTSLPPITGCPGIICGGRVSRPPDA